MLQPNVNLLLKIKGTNFRAFAGVNNTLPLIQFEIASNSAHEELFNKTINYTNNNIVISSQQLVDGSSLAHLTGTETLVTKTIIDSGSNIAARGLWSGSGSTITSTYTSTPPAPGQVLTAINATSALWATPGSSSGRKTYMLYSGLSSATDTTYTTVAYFSWLNSRFVGYSGGVIVYGATISGTNLDVQLYDATSSVILGADLNVGATDTRSFSIANPIANAQLELHIRKTNSGGINPTISGVELEFN